MQGERTLHVKKKAADECWGSGNGEKAKEREKERWRIRQNKKGAIQHNKDAA